MEVYRSFNDPFAEDYWRNIKYYLTSWLFEAYGMVTLSLEIIMVEFLFVYLLFQCRTNGTAIAQIHD
jgi:hypothetical protein